MTAWRDDSWKYKLTWLLLLCCGWELFTSCVLNTSAPRPAPPNLSKHSTACFHSIYAFCCVRTSSLSSNNNNNKTILLQNCQWKSIASCKFWQALQRDINTVTPLSAFIWDIVYEMFNGLSQVYFMFWTAPKVKKRALEFYSLCLMQYHAAVAWAVIKRRATTRMHTLWFMETMDPTAEITVQNISFMGWDGPKINHRKRQLCQNCLFLCTTGTLHTSLKH